MYNVAKNVIMSQRFELTEMLRKLDVLWMRGDLTDTQKTELDDLARSHADPAMSIDLMGRIEDHEQRLRKLEQGTAPGPSEDYPEYQLHKAYVTGDKVTFAGKRYICTLPEHTLSTTWSPADYPPYWQEV